MTDLLPLIKNLKDCAHYSIRSNIEKRKAFSSLCKNYQDNDETNFEYQYLRGRLQYIDGEYYALSNVLSELNYILALAEETQEEEDEDEEEERQNES